MTVRVKISRIRKKFGINSTSLKYLTQLLTDLSNFRDFYFKCYFITPPFIGIKFKCAHVVKVFIYSVQISSLSLALSHLSLLIDLGELRIVIS